MLRFVHTGDLHLDSPFLGLTSEAPASVTALLREATFQAWKEVVELALREHAQFMVVAGDVFEHANHTLRGQLAFRDGLARLAKAGIPSFVVTGNHDPESGWAPSVAWPELAHRFPTDRVEGVPVVRDGEEVARIYGISYRNREVRSNLALKFKREANVPFAVGLLHANVGCDASAPDYACAQASRTHRRISDRRLLRQHPGPRPG
jgi:DNA repair exonuclease SbcCD nuclease subunit